MNRQFSTHCHTGNLEKVKIELDNITEEDIVFGYSLACLAGKVEIVKFLFDSGKLPSYTENGEDIKDFGFRSSCGNKTGKPVQEYFIKKLNYVPNDDIKAWMKII